MTRVEIKLGGYGGQGIITMAQLFAKGAALLEGKEVAQTEAYGAAARGGSCWAEVVISDEKINYPRATIPDILVVLTKAAADSFKKDVKSDTTVFLDPLTVSKFRGKQKIYEIPAQQVAREEFNLPVVANVIMFGAIVAISNLISRENAKKNRRNIST